MTAKQEQIGNFLDALASDAPTPGGGGAAAIMGAVGAALVSMVANLTIGKKNYEAFEAELKEANAKAEAKANASATPDRRKRILVTLLVDEEERQALRGLAEYDHTSQSGWMRKVIREQARALAADLRKKGKRAVEAFDL